MQFDFEYCMHPFLALRASKQLSCRIMTFGSFSISFVSLVNFKGRSSSAFNGLERVCVCVCTCAQLISSVWLYEPTDWGSPSSPVHGIFQARILEWVTISLSRGSSRLRDRALVSCISCTGRWILYYWASWEALQCLNLLINPLVNWNCPE